eukprot:TRINITY_DN13181_c0_g1_i1.p1 TRINITY_DN13181_c0_g1~~TRINITY_DN13181_c0_g1_i1.p1  ORF type:complete len:393 (+),score=104.73 TRINITY_DN13181_c0_g1_i1:37-1215(+)
MGIQGLTKLISDNAPEVLKEGAITSYFGRLVAIDASMSLYQFVIAVRPDELGQYTLTNDYGETTSHLQGMFYRTIRMLTNGLKPVYVFDGKPPDLKAGEISKRKQKKAEAQEALEKAQTDGDREAQVKLNKRTASVTKEMNEEAKKLLRLMGVPVVEAPGEAEAQCARLCREGKVWAAGTEDMDTLTCGTTRLLRHLTYAEARKEPILEIHLQDVLCGLGLTMDEFIDLCILLGCDYSDKIRGIGPVRALEYIKKYHNIETILENLDKSKYVIPDPFPYEAIREYFKNPDTTPSDEIELNFTEPDEAGLIKFLCEEKGFSEDRVKAGVEKIRKAKNKGAQSRITSFFTVNPLTEEEKKAKAAAAKNKIAAAKKRGRDAKAPVKGSPAKRGRK